MVMQTAGLYDPFTHTMWDDPYPVYRRLRVEHPLYHNENRDCWVLSRFDDIQAVSRDTMTYSCAEGVDFDLPAGYLGPGSFLDADPPVHTRLRKVLHEHFSPKAMQRLETLVRGRVQLLLSDIADGEAVDLARRLAYPLPMFTILTVMGFPEEDTKQLHEWLDATALRTPGSSDRPPECDAAHDALAAYMAALIEARQDDPREDLVTVMAQAVADGRMSLEETHGMSLLLLTAGWETTASLISNAIHLLATHPVELRNLAHDPGAIPAAVEEVLRYEAPVQYLARTTTRDVDIHDSTVPRGGTVLLLYASANRDESRWDQADVFLVKRQPLRNLAFGEGIHHCIGAPLARMEARIALEELVARWPTFNVDGPTERIEAHVLRGFAQLPIRVQPA